MNWAKKLFVTAITLVTSITALPVFAKPFESEIMHRLPVEVEDTGGTLIFSDSPEYVTRDGILYTDTVKGDARILFYHLNNTGVPKKIAVVVENISGGNNTIEITRGGFSAPSDNFLWVGKETQLKYMKNRFHDTIRFLKNGRKLFQQKMDRTIIQPGHLVYGVYDFKTSAPVRIFVLMYPVNVNPLEFINDAEILPKDEYQLRGTFKNMNRVISLKGEYNPETDGIGYVLIGDDATDLFRRGIDATDGSETVNVGNYGINYILNFNTKADTRFCLSPLGGTYAGAMSFYYNKKRGTILTPRSKLYFGDKTPSEPEEVAREREKGTAFWTNFLEISELGKYNGEVRFEYSPPGASNLPVHIVLMPTD